MLLGTPYLTKIETLRQLDKEELAALSGAVEEHDPPPDKKHEARPTSNGYTAEPLPEWEPPIPFDNVSVPLFPIDCLPEPLQNYVVSVSEATQTSVDMAAVTELRTMAVCVQGKYKIQGKPDWTEPLNLYSVVVLNPAERKSAVLRFATEYINDYEREYNEQRKEELNRNRTEKALLEREVSKLLNQCSKNKADKKELFRKQDELTNFDEMRPLRLLADDASPEALTSLLARNGGKIVVISSEGGIFEIINGRYSQTVNMDVFLKAHCGDLIRIDRKGRENEYIAEPCMSMLLTVQPQVLDGLVNNDIFRGRGLTARFLYCLPTSPVGTREFETPEIPEEHKKRYKELCNDLLGLNPTMEPLTLSTEAYRLSKEFAEKLEPR